MFVMFRRVVPQSQLRALLVTAFAVSLYIQLPEPPPHHQLPGADIGYTLTIRTADSTQALQGPHETCTATVFPAG